MNEFVEQFLLEARELVEQATGDLLALENGTPDKGRVDSLFRAFHTLKGAAGIVDFVSMGRALHAVEEVLSEVRSGARPVSPTLVDDCLSCLDQVTRWLDEMQTTGAVPASSEDAAERIVRKFSDAAAPVANRAHVARPARNEDHRTWLDVLCADHSDELPQSRTAFCYRPDPQAFFRGEDPLAIVDGLPGLVVLDLAWQGSSVLEDADPFSCAIHITGLAKAGVSELKAALHDVVSQVEIVELEDRDRNRIPSGARSVLEEQVFLLHENGAEGKAGRLSSAGRVAVNVLRYLGSPQLASELDAAAAKALAGSDTAGLVDAIRVVLGNVPERAVADTVAQADAAPALAARVMRVDSGRIDALVTLTGELTVVKNAFGHIASLGQGGLDQKSLVASLREQHARLDRLVGELQRAVLRIRVLPLRQVFQRFPRQVREISAKLGKSVKLATEGDDTEADAAIVESLFEPLLHVVRNAIDHGIEASAQRDRLGKPAMATVTLRARRRLENVIVEVADDGRGVDLERVRQVALARNLLTSDALAAMDDAEVVALIFAPGFSTASEVTGLSGRGVGMDSVKTAVERLGGSVFVESRPGHGTTVRLTLPFTVMMTRVMTVETAGQVFGIPLDAVIETAAVARDNLVPVGRGRAFVLRDRTIPVVDLAESLGLSKSAPPGGEAKVVVTSAGGLIGGIEVEKLGERMDVMLKPMDGLLRNMRGVAGTTLLGDGRVLIVLDVQELFQ